MLISDLNKKTERRLSSVCFLIIAGLLLARTNGVAAQTDRVYRQNYESDYSRQTFENLGQRDYEVDDRFSSQPRSPDRFSASSTVFDELPPPAPTLNTSIRRSEIVDGQPYWEQSDFFEAEKPSDSRDGFFQRVEVIGTWIPSAQSGDLGFSDLEISAVFAVPMLTKESPMLITPRFATHYVDGPITPDLPSRLYDSSIQLRWFRPLGERWVADLAIEPGMHGDYQAQDDDTFRVRGHGFGIFKWRPDLKLVVGVLYLDREDVNLLPAGGLIWEPHDDFKMELLFPSPKIAWRFGVDDCCEYWYYLAAEFGGGPYAIQRTSGAQDVVIFRDYRIMFGVEHDILGGLKSRVELGYVFGREAEFINTGTPDYEADPTLLLRLGFRY